MKKEKFNLKKFLKPITSKIIIATILLAVLFISIGIPVVDYILCEPCLIEDCTPCTREINLITVGNALSGIIGGELNMPLLVGLIILELVIGYFIASLVRYEYWKQIK